MPVAREELEYKRLQTAYRSSLVALGVRILGSVADAEELVDSALADFLVRYWEQLRHPAAERRFLWLMVHSRAQQQRSRDGRFVDLPEEEAGGPVEVLGAEPAPLEEQALFHHLLPRVARCRHKLSLKAQHALWLRYGQELTQEEIGHQLEASKQYIGKLLRDSLETLRRCLEHGWHQAAPAAGEVFMRWPATEPLTTGQVEQLLTLQYQLSSRDCPELPRVARCEAGLGEAAEQAAVARHLTECPSCAQAVAALRELDAGGATDGPSAPVQLKLVAATPARSGPRPPRSSFLIPPSSFRAAAAVLLLLGSGWLVYQVAQSPEPGLTPGTATPVVTPGHPPGPVCMGGGDRLLVELRRAGVWRRLEGDGPTRPQVGDELRFLHSSCEPGYLAVVSVTGTGEVVLLQPTRVGDRGAIPAGSELPLVGGGELTPGQGCEWIVGLFATEPLPLAVLQHSLAEAAASRTGGGSGAAGCELPIAGLRARFPGIRHVEVVPFAW